MAVDQPIDLKHRSRAIDALLNNRSRWAAERVLKNLIECSQVTVGYFSVKNNQTDTRRAATGLNRGMLCHYSFS
jgi:hypothetical protein